MLKRIKDLLQENFLLKGSLVLFVGSSLASFGMYLFHLLTGRLLGPADYGLLVSLISLTYFLGIPMSILSLVLVKYVSTENHDKEKVGAFVKKISETVSIAGAVLLLFFLLLFPVMKSLIKVDSFLLYLGIGIFSYLGILMAIFAASLQGLLKFNQLSLLSIFNSWIKLLLALVFIFCGFKVGGAVLGITLGTLLTVFFGFLLIRKYLFFNSDLKIELKSAFKGIGSYSLAVFFNNVSLTCLYTVDIILARYFLLPLESGYYAALSSLGKIIFFASSPIVSVMFPLVSSRQSQGKNYYKTFFFSFILVTLISLSIACLYFLFPQQMVSFLYGQRYLEISRSLGLFAIFISLYSLSSLFLNFFLSIGKTKITLLPLLSVIFQIVFISLYHNSLDQIIMVNLSVSTILTTGLLFFFLKIGKIREAKKHFSEGFLSL